MVPTLLTAKREPFLPSLKLSWAGHVLTLLFFSSLWLSGYFTEKPLVHQITALNIARKLASSSNPQFISTALRFTSVTESTFAISKPPMLALLTNQGSGGSPVWDVPDAGFGAGETVVDVLTCATFNADANGGVTVTGSAGAPVVLLPQSVVNTSGGKLCA